MEDILRPVICQRIVTPVTLERLFLHSQGIKETIETCRSWEGCQYPPPGINDAFNGVICRLKVGPSKISGRGTFLARGSLSKHELLGFYEGILTLTRGPYVMAMFKGRDAKMIDGDPRGLGHESPFGMMNENLYTGVPNVEVLPSGLFRAIRDIKEGEELVIQYAASYDWDELKSAAFMDLSRVIDLRIPEMWNWIPRSWAAVKMNRDHISRWIKKIIDGTLELSEPLSLHSSCNENPLDNARDRLVRFLTAGVTARAFNFKIWKREDRTWVSLPFDRDEIKRGKFSKRWTDRKLMDIPFNTVVKDNSAIRDFTRQVRLMTRPKNSKLVACPAVLIEVGDIKISLDLGKRKLDQHLGELNKYRNVAQLKQQRLEGDLQE